jgi:hypothetical protein
MKYTTEIVLDIPRSKVIEFFDNPENMKFWQEGFISYEHINGEPGEVGSQMRLKYDMGKRKIDMIETISSRDLPDEFNAIYETKGVWNEVKNFFYEEGNTTRMVTENEFRFSSIFMKMMGIIMPGAFKKQTLKYAEAFKAFAEKKYKEEKA